MSRPNAKDRNSIVVDSDSDSDNAEKIRVGKNYQAVCPEYVPEKSRNPETLDEKALLVWKPETELSDSEIEEFIQMAQNKHGYNMEQALGMLYWHNYNIKNATDDFLNFEPYPNEWTPEDEVLFEQAFQFHGKSFNRIRQMLPDKSVGSLVKYYYSWKKTRTKTSVMDRQEQILAKNGTANDNSSERESNENSDVDDKSGKLDIAGRTTATTNLDPIASTSITSTINNCNGCGVACSEIHSTIHGRLCSSCFHHYKRTGVLRPISAPFQNKRSRPNENGKYKKHPPKGIYFNHDDIVKLAQVSQDSTNSVKQQNDIVSTVDRECASRLSRIQNNKQKISKNKKILEKILTNQAPELNRTTNYVMSVRWTNEENFLAVEGFKNHGKDFATIANIMGTKTEAQLKTFFLNYRRRYNLDKHVREYEMKHGIRNKSLTTNNTTPQKDANKTETTLPPVEIDLDEENTSVNIVSDDLVSSSQ